MRQGRSWQHRVPLGARLAIVAVVAGLALVPTWSQALDRGAAERDLITLTNSDRTSNGLSSLRPNDPLADVARGRSEDMADRNYFSHEIPPDNHYFEDELPPAGINYRMAGENIARNNANDRETVQRAETGFLNSPPHRANIMESNYREIGVGAWDRADGFKYFTVLFLTPQGASAATPPSRLLADAPPAAADEARLPRVAEALLGPAATAHAQATTTQDEGPPLSEGSGRIVTNGAPPAPTPAQQPRMAAEVVTGQPAQLGLLDGIITRVLKLYLSV
ncbi:MAG TPA: CAP domain-containing protein [Chloroflexota bacterium]|jgi:uncharacterized protein YkwD